MSRLFGLCLIPLLLFPACESDEPTVEDDAAAVVTATIDVAVFLCECSLDADDDDPDACVEAADEVFGPDVDACIEDLVASDPSSREVLQCSTTALRVLLDCYEGAAICPESDSSSSPSDDSTEEDDGPISDDACGLAFEVDVAACGELSDQTQDAFETCFLGAQPEAEACPGDDC